MKSIGTPIDPKDLPVIDMEVPPLPAASIIDTSVGQFISIRLPSVALCGEVMQSTISVICHGDGKWHLFFPEAAPPEESKSGEGA